VREDQIPSTRARSYIRSPNQRPAFASPARQSAAKWSGAIHLP